MPNPSEMSTRKLTTIMFTDIAGFSKKLAENEVRAFELLKTHDALIRVLAAKFDGKVIKSLGDSFMVDFSNSVNAVKCAVEIQKRFWNFNRGKAESDTIRVRAGIHLGEIIIRNDDVVGEGATIASRIEALTEPNRICISLDVYDHVKNTLSLQVFKIGAIELKDISRTVEVYEVLIDTIPELSHPSAVAKQASLSQQHVLAEKREAEEMYEAKHIEETKQRLLSDQAKADEERRRKIAAHYERAQIYFEAGDLKNAESELAEITKFEAQQRPTTERQQQEETERSIQDHMTKARDLFAQKDLDAAEEEVNEIFRILPLHIGAQQLLMQIEEERYRQEERKRAKYTESTVKQISEDERKIEELLDRAQTLLQEEKFTEAIFVLHDLFLIDPNHSGARRLEESIHQAEKAKLELMRIQSEQVHEEQHMLELDKLQRKLDERKKQELPHPPKVEQEPKSKRLYYIVFMIILLAVSFFGLLRLLDWVFPKTTSIAVLRFTNAPHDTNDIDLLESLPVLLSEDFEQCEHLTVIAPSSSLQDMHDPMYLRKISSMPPAEYLLTGTIQESRGRYTILIRLINPAQQKIAYTETVEGPLSALNEMRATIVMKTLEKMEVKSNLPEIIQPPNIKAFTVYLKGVRLMQSKSKLDIDSTITLLRAAVQIDPSFGRAYGELADAELLTFNMTKNAQFLQSAVEHARQALRCSPRIAPAYRILATNNMYAQNYNEALSSFTRSLMLLPQNPACTRGLALLSLIAGKLDEASSYASNALLHDPKNAESHFTLALVQHMKLEYAAARNSYQQAQLLGDNNSLLITNCILNTLIGEGQFDKVISRCQQSLITSPNDYRYYYWIGRAYQLSLEINAAQQWLGNGLALTQRIIEADQNDAIAYAYAGLFYSRMGKFPEGEAAMNKAMQLDSSSIEVRFRNAKLYSVQRNKKKALAALDIALHQQYVFSELLDPDLSYIMHEPEYLPIVTRKIEGKWPLK